MYRNLLVPLDGSPFSERALPYACGIAKQSGARIHLAHVHMLNDPISIEGLPVIDADLHSLGREHERAYLAGIRDRLESEGFPITCANLDNESSVAGTLAHYLELNNIDLVVMTTHGRGGLARAWLGSVADGLVRCSVAPLLLLRPGEGPAGTNPTPLFKHILLPLDGSALSEQILEPAVELGRLAQARYTLLRAIEPFVLVGYAPHAQAIRLDVKLSQEELAQAQRYLETVAERLRAEGQIVDTRALLAELPALMILDEARQQQADLIAMATHGRSGFKRLILGSVADKVLRSSMLPVLMVHPRN